MKEVSGVVFALMACAMAWAGTTELDSDDTGGGAPRQVRVAVIPCRGTIDDAMFFSIRRRTEAALEAGSEYLFYQMETYGGMLGAADSIAKYLIQHVADRAHTVAYVTSEAISAGALISVSCEDIIMLENTTIGDAAPITIGGQLEGVEREKIESFLRAAFQRAGEANGYPELLLRAMVTVRIEVYRVLNLQTGEYEFFEADTLPKDPNKYEIENAVKIVGDEELLTLTAPQAREYGVARAVVQDLDGAMAFLEERDNVAFQAEPLLLEPTWSEHMVSWLNSPAVMAILFMLMLLGAYIEFSTPGFGLPGLVAVACLAILLGSRYLVGLANWVEILLLFAGLVLLAIELFVLPGFGIAGILGIVCILGGLFGMLIRNAPGELPWPQTIADWETISQGAIGLAMGFGGFLILAWLVSRYLPKLEFMSGLILAPTAPGVGSQISMTVPPESSEVGVQVGDTGEVISTLRPAGKARFGDAVVDVVATGEFLGAGTMVEIIEIRGSRVVVRAVEQGDEA